jgi:hypothetical protein
MARVSLSVERKRVEPIAASVDPLQVSARHQSRHHFVAKSGWWDEEMLRRVREWIRPKLGGGRLLDRRRQRVSEARPTLGGCGAAGLRGVRWYSRDALRNGSPSRVKPPTQYDLSTLPDTCTLDERVDVAHQRWRIERDYQKLKQKLKQEFGLDPYEGHGWRGFHHHAGLRIAAHGFLPAARLNGDPACPRRAMARWIRFQQTVKVCRLRSLPLKICPGTLDIERAASASPGHLASALGMDSVVDPVHGDCRIDPQPVAHR